MATWLEKSRSPEYSPAKLSQTLAEVEAVIGISELDEAMAHETIIVGGYLNTHLIKAKSIIAEHLDVDSLSAISADIGNVTSGTITGALIRTSAGDDRIELSSNLLRAYSGGTRRVQLDYDSLDFYDSSGSLSGSIRGMLPEDEYDPSQLEVESGHVVLRSGNASIYTFQGSDIGIPPLAVMESSYPGSYGIVEVGPGGVIIEGSGGSLLVGPDGVSAFADMHLYGTIYLDDGMGDPPTISTLTSSGRQGLLIRADEAGNSAGINLYGEYDSNYPSAVMLRSGGQTTLHLDANRDARFHGNLRVDGAITSPTVIELTQNTRVTGWLQPKTNNTYSLGGGSSRWSRIYLQYNPDVASDIRLKSSIQNIPNELLAELKEIKPKMYQQGEKWHFGYIAQDVERALYRYALKTVGWEKAKDYAREFDVLYKDESYLSLVYAEIAVLKEAEMQARIDELESKVKQLLQ